MHRHLTCAWFALASGLFVLGIEPGLAHAQLHNCGLLVDHVLISPSHPGSQDVIGFRVNMSPDLIAIFDNHTRFFSRATIGTADRIGTNIDVDVIIGNDSLSLSGYEVAGSYDDDFVGHLGPLPAGTYNITATVRAHDPATGT